MANKITSFTGEYRFLSNFYLSPITDEYGVVYPSSEHMYQCAKFWLPDVQTEIRMAETPGKAKKLAKKYTPVGNWNVVKFSVMERIIRLKFTQNLELKQKLIDTKDSILEEGNTWGDTYWGIYKDFGQNNLGKLLMSLREEFQNEIKEQDNE